MIKDKYYYCNNIVILNNLKVVFNNNNFILQNNSKITILMFVWISLISNITLQTFMLVQTAGRL